MKLTAQQVDALVRLRANADFAIFQDIVREHQRQLLARLTQATDTATIFRSQGGLTATGEMLTAYAEAPDTMDKLKGKKEHA